MITNKKVLLSDIEFKDINGLIYNKCGIHIKKRTITSA